MSKEGLTGQWMQDCFGITPELMALKVSASERIARILEETAELAQAEGITFEEYCDIGRDVWARPVGNAQEELGGVMICLAAYAHIRGWGLDQEWSKEFGRINRPEKIAKIRARQETKRHIVR